MKLVLASASPRRKDLLERLGLRFEVDPPDVDESRLPDEPAATYVERVSRLKATTIVSPGTVVIAADTAVVHEGRILGKPAHPEEARSMLRRIEGDRHEVFTGVAAATAENGLEVVSMVDVTEVALLTMTAEEIASYVESGEPMDKAGAYALQERGGRFVERVSGSPFTVIGLPVHLLPRLLRRVGAEFDEFVETSGGAD